MSTTSVFFENLEKGSRLKGFKGIVDFLIGGFGVDFCTTGVIDNSKSTYLILYSN